MFSFSKAISCFQNFRKQKTSLKIRSVVVSENDFLKLWELRKFWDFLKTDQPMNDRERVGTTRTMNQNDREEPSVPGEEQIDYVSVDE